MYLISPKTRQYKANLHCHSVCSDGRLTPQVLKEAYQAQGYQILAITDHECPMDHTAMSEPDFLMLTGYEAHIRPNSTGLYNAYQSEIHMNLFARDPHNTSLICYDPRYSKFMPPEQLAATPKAGSQRPREYTTEYINEFVRTAKENGYIVSYNHPVWSMESEARIASYQGFFSMEIVNYGSYIINNMEYNGHLYDKLLLGGKRLFVHAGDDDHNVVPLDDPKSDSFGSATMILADDLTYDAVFSAMEKGQMYATMGPTFRAVSFDGETVHVECSDVAAVYCHMGSKAPVHARAKQGQCITCADLKVDKNCRYVRISIVDAYGRHADTRAFFRDELGLPPLE